jgi:hypothetical protein
MRKTIEKGNEVYIGILVKDEDLDFVDDLCLLSQNFKDRNQKMQDLIKIVKGSGLKINSQKSKIM